MKLLFIEEDATLLKRLVLYFALKYSSEQARNYQEAIAKVSMHEYESIVLNTKSSTYQVFDIIKFIKQKQPNSSILIISNKNDLENKIKCFDLGVDDYLAHPFHIEELDARLKAIYRRKSFNGSDHIIFDNFNLNPSAKELQYNNTVINLTKKEFELLVYFYTNRNKIINKIAIAEQIWGDHYSDEDNLDVIYVHLNNLRKKLHKASDKDYIQTVWGRGYKFCI